MLVMDPQQLGELPDNRIGEVWAAGPSIAHGYWRNPEATAKTFVQHAGRTWLRTTSTSRSMVFSMSWG
ncbi:AMP-binding protein [Pseudomonas protegens]|nr:AMP-binding protein [Pseudomonas protegens]